MERLLRQAQEGGLEEDDDKRGSATVVKNPASGPGLYMLLV